MSTFATLNQGSTGMNLIKEEKETNDVKIGEKKNENRTSDHVMFYTEKPKRYSRKLSELI